MFGDSSHTSEAIRVIYEKFRNNYHIYSSTEIPAEKQKIVLTHVNVVLIEEVHADITVVHVRG